MSSLMLYIKYREKGRTTLLCPDNFRYKKIQFFISVSLQPGSLSNVTEYVMRQALIEKKFMVHTENTEGAVMIRKLRRIEDKFLLLQVDCKCHQNPPKFINIQNFKLRVFFLNFSFSSFFLSCFLCLSLSLYLSLSLCIFPFASSFLSLLKIFRVYFYQ